MGLSGIDTIAGTITTAVVEKFSDEAAYRRARDAAGGDWNPMELLLPAGVVLSDQVHSVDLGALASSARGEGLRALLAMEHATSVEAVLGNLLLNEGGLQMWRRLTGLEAQDQLFDNGHARIGVGDSNAAAARTQAGLQGASKSYAVMEAGYPVLTPGDGAAGALCTFRAVFAGAAAVHSHLEWVIDNKGGDPVGAVTLNRKVQNFGEKADGAVWIYTFAAELGS